MRLRLLALCVLIASPASAAPLTLTFALTGTETTPTADGLSIATAFASTASVTFDPDVAPLIWSDHTQAWWSFFDQPDYAFTSPIATVGTVLRDESAFRISQNDSFGLVQMFAGARLPGSTQGFSFLMIGQPVPVADLPTETFGKDWIVPMLERSTLDFTFGTMTARYTGIATFTGVVPVPEPSTLSLLIFLAGPALVWRHGAQFDVWKKRS